MSSSIKTTLFTDVSVAAEMLRSGRLVAFPTETVYGLGADATNSDSVARIFESKGRPRFDPLIVHVHDASAAADLVTEFPETAQKLAEAFWPGPLTLVLPKKDHVSDLVTAGLAGVGIRVPGNDTARELIKLADRPVAAPSANPFSGISPTCAQHVMDGLGGRIDGILDGGPCRIGVESTVVSLLDNKPTLFRPGGLPVETIEEVIGPLHRLPVQQPADTAAQPAPGMLSRHYAPDTGLRIISADTTAVPVPGKRCGLLTWGPSHESGEWQQIERICAGDDLRQCAANFFAALRSLDAQNLDVIIARSFPETGLGLALNDRLQRAAHT